MKGTVILESPRQVRVSRPDTMRSEKPGKGWDALNWVALAMVTGDRAKYIGLIFAISFSSFLITQQASSFSGLMNRIRSQVLDITKSKMLATSLADVFHANPGVLPSGNRKRGQSAETLF